MGLMPVMAGILCVAGSGVPCFWMGRRLPCAQRPAVAMVVILRWFWARETP